MRRAPVIASAIAVTIALAVVLVLGIFLLNRDRIGLADLGAAATGSQGSDVISPVEGEDPDLGPTKTYNVLDDGSLSPAATGLTADVWNAFTRVTTLDYAAETILTFTTGDSTESDLLAYVQQDLDRPQYWHFAVNLAGATDMSYLLSTLIHEYTHILTLNLTQTSPDLTCEVTYPSEGCWYVDAYLRAFWDEFWAGYGDAGPVIGADDDDAVAAFYAEHEDDFVSEYAATNVEEDIAESFMAYVIEPVPDPAQSPVAAKLAFFERFPELVAIRERIRAEFGDELQPVWDP